MSLRSLALACALSLVVTGGAGCGPQSDNNPYKFGDLGGMVPCDDPPADTDGDHISDENEGKSGNVDTDGDGVPDYKDTDSDGDGIPDVVESRAQNVCTLPADSDGDGKPDFRDLDSDDPTDKSIPDHIEAGATPGMPVDTDQDGEPDYMDRDDDGDGIPDLIELTADGAAQPANTPALAPDTDGDGTPDYLDLDSDGDTILDADEKYSDVDGDLIPNFRDTDTDGDCVLDSIEAGDGNLATAPVDTDGDGTPDFADLDSDNDGLIDGTEDKNCNGVVDTCETSRLDTDTDHDGVSDLVEVTACQSKSAAEQQATMCTCDGSNAAVTPQTHGDFVFVVDYQQAPAPMSEVLSLSDNVHQADVVFAIDTTGSMGSSIANLRAGLADLVSKALVAIPDLAFGVYEFRDLGYPQMQPTNTAEGPANLPSFVYDQRIETVGSTGLAAVQNALNGLTAQGGGDGPEAGWEALYTLANGTNRTINVTNSVTYNLATNPAALTVSTGETGGTLGGAGFRVGSVPIVITVSDAEFHDAPGSLANGDPESGLNAYPSTSAFGHVACDPCTNAPSRRDAITALQNLGAHVMNLAALGNAQTGDPKARGIKTAQETGAVVGPSDFGPSSVRAAGCAVDQCCTGYNGAGEASLGGTCPLSFTVSDDDGSGVSGSILDGITALATGLRFDVHVEATDVDPNTIDNFMASVTPNLTGMGDASMCVTMAPSPLQDNFSGPKAIPGPDGTVDTFPGLKGGQLVCFDVTAKMNNSVMNTSSPQLFRALLTVKGKSGTNSVNLGVPRTVYFLVPPKIANPPVL